MIEIPRALAQMIFEHHLSLTLTEKEKKQLQACELTLKFLNDGTRLKRMASHLHKNER